MNFGQALEALKKGKRVAREGWNGKNIYVQLQPSISFEDIMKSVKKSFGVSLVEGWTLLHHGTGAEYAVLEPFIVIKNVKNSFNTWVPSISDLLAEDWNLVNRDES